MRKRLPTFWQTWRRSSWHLSKSGSWILNQKKQDYNPQDPPPRPCFYHRHLTSLWFYNFLEQCNQFWIRFKLYQLSNLIWNVLADIGSLGCIPAQNCSKIFIIVLVIQTVSSTLLAEFFTKWKFSKSSQTKQSKTPKASELFYIWEPGTSFYVYFHTHCYYLTSEPQLPPALGYVYN